MGACFSVGYPCFSAGLGWWVVWCAVDAVVVGMAAVLSAACNVGVAEWRLEFGLKLVRISSGCGCAGMVVVRLRLIVGAIQVEDWVVAASNRGRGGIGWRCCRHEVGEGAVVVGGWWV